MSRIPRQFICPISMGLIRDPVITTAGLTYERAYIEEWFRTGHDTDPMAHVPISMTLIPNILVKQQIEEFMTNFAVQQQQHQSEEDSKLAMQLCIEELTKSINSQTLEMSQMQQHIEDHFATLSISKVINKSCCAFLGGDDLIRAYNVHYFSFTACICFNE